MPTVYARGGAVVKMQEDMQAGAEAGRQTRLSHRPTSAYLGLS